MIRFGVVGTNWITDRFLAAALLHEDFTLAAVCSRSEERGLAFGSKYGVSTVFRSIEEMAESGEVDAVYVATPNSLHAGTAIAAMERGVHVLCEKPIASNSGELADMLASARKNGVALMEAVKSTLMPGFDAVREHLNEIGPVRRYAASFCQYSSRYDAYKAGEVLNAFRPELSNGALMDIGIYCIYPAVVLFGRPRSVKATGFMLESGVDGEGSVLLEYEGMDAVMHYSKITHSAMPNEILGEDGSLIINKISEPYTVELHRRDGNVRDLSRTAVEHSMYYEVKEFIAMIAEGRQESAINSWENSVICMEIMDEVRRQIGLSFPADN
ncbi:Gfo/Idh/MocA family protein [Paenibacillus sp. CAU 1782]